MRIGCCILRLCLSVLGKQSLIDLSDLLHRLCTNRNTSSVCGLTGGVALRRRSFLINRSASLLWFLIESFQKIFINRRPFHEKFRHRTVVEMNVTHGKRKEPESDDVEVTRFTAIPDELLRMIFSELDSQTRRRCER